MAVFVAVRNDIAIRGAYRGVELRRIAERVCAGEGVPGDIEISVLFCGDDTIRALNAQYGNDDSATDVLAFEQGGIQPLEGPRLLGDIAISLETVERTCGGRIEAMRENVKLLFCHGLLHLLGYDHDSAAGKRTMTAKQAEYLACSLDAAWFRGH